MGISISQLHNQFGFTDSNVKFSQLYQGQGLVPSHEWGSKPINGNLNTTVDTPVPTSGTISLGNFNNVFNTSGSQVFTTVGTTYWTVPKDVSSVTAYFPKYNEIGYTSQTWSATPGDIYDIYIPSIAEIASSNTYKAAVRDNATGANYCIADCISSPIWSFQGNIDATLIVKSQVSVDTWPPTSFSNNGSGGQYGVYEAALAGGFGYYYYEDDHGDLSSTTSGTPIYYPFFWYYGANQTVQIGNYSGRYTEGTITYPADWGNNYFQINQYDGYPDEGSYAITVQALATSIIALEWY